MSTLSGGRFVLWDHDPSLGMKYATKQVRLLLDLIMTHKVPVTLFYYSVLFPIPPLFAGKAEL
jgi:hypothetical protein